VLHAPALETLETLEKTSGGSREEYSIPDWDVARFVRCREDHFGKFTFKQGASGRHDSARCRRQGELSYVNSLLLPKSAHSLGTQEPAKHAFSKVRVYSYAANGCDRV
jgi:hypothetical protein